MNPYENARSKVESSLQVRTSLEVMHRLNQVQYVTEMIASYMEDIYDQLTTMESNMENLQEGIEEVQNEIEEFSCLIENQIDLERNAQDNSDRSMNEVLPF